MIPPSARRAFCQRPPPTCIPARICARSWVRGETSGSATIKKKQRAHLRGIRRCARCYFRLESPADNTRGFTPSGDGHLVAQIDILDAVQDLNALGARALKSLSPAD